MSQADWFDRLSRSIRTHETERRETFTSIGRYRLMEELGRGGMGVVYHAFDPQLGREVALKVLLDRGFASAEARERFLREAHVAARLSHPNIIPVFDTGEHEGKVYLAMQFVEGTSLDRAKPGPREAVTGVRDAARAVHAAHEEGIVHRDLKPANLMLDRAGRVYVTDFGLARRVESGASLTLSGTVVGTPAYMPPEQATGKATDARSDVYALGATLYEVLTGKPPFSGATPLETLKAVTLDEPVPPRRHNAEISKGLEAVVLKAMDKKPEGRYPTAAAFADDLDRWLRGEEVHAPVRGTVYRLRKKVVRHRWRVVSASSLGALILVVSVAIALRPDPRIAEVYRLIAERKYPEARTLIDKLPPDHREALTSALRRARDLEKGSPAPPWPLPKPDPDGWTARENAVHDLLTQRKTEEAREEIRTLEEEGYSKARLLRERLRTIEFEDGLETLGALAVSREAGKFEILYERLRGPDYKDEKGAAAKLAALALSMGLRLAEGSDKSEAIRWLDTAESLGSGSVELFETRGLLRMAGGDWDGAGKDHADYDRLRPNAHPKNPRYSELLRHRAGEATKRQAWKESLGLLKSAVEINPRDARAIHDLGLARFRADGQVREALAELRTALGLDPALRPSPEYAEVALLAARQRSQAWRLEDPAAREAAWKDALQALDLALDRVVPGDPALLLERGLFRRRLGDLAGAAQDAGKAGDSSDAFLMRGKASYPADLASATAAFEQAAVRNPKSALARYWRGVCLQALRKHAPAKEEFLAAVSLGFDGPDLHARLAAIALEQQAWPEIPGRTARVHETAEAVSEDELLARRADSRSGEVRHLRRDAYYLLARARFESKDYEKAVDECALALTQDPMHYEAHFRKAYALFRLRRHDEAIKTFGRAVELKPGSAEPLVGRATALAEKGLLDDALRDYDAALRIEPDNYTALGGRGLARGELNLVSDARADLKRALELAPETWNGRDRIQKALAELR
jgi:serine/threonine protein kinase/Tfp pilus assembly protein PilF